METHWRSQKGEDAVNWTGVKVQHCWVLGAGTDPWKALEGVSLPLVSVRDTTQPGRTGRYQRPAIHTRATLVSWVRDEPPWARPTLSTGIFEGFSGDSLGVRSIA